MANEFKPALPKQGKWSVGENRFDEEGQNPKSLSIFIPEDSIDGFCRYVQNLRSKAKPGKSYNYETKSNEEVQGKSYLNFKRKSGKYQRQKSNKVLPPELQRQVLVSTATIGQHQPREQRLPMMIPF